MATSNESLSRFRPIIYIITGAAASYGLYAIYNSLAHPPSAPLRRSNAVHRRRRPTSIPTPPNNQSWVTTPSQRPPLNVRFTTEHGEFMYLDNSKLLIAPGGRSHEYTVDFSVENPPIWRALVDSARDSLRDAGQPDPTEDALAHAWELYYTAWGMVHVYRVLQWPSAVSEGRYNAAINFIRAHGLTQSQSRHCMQIFIRNIDRLPPFPSDPAQVDGQTDAAGETVAGTEMSFHTADDAATVEEQREQRVEGQNLKSMLYYIAEEQAKNEGYIHRGIQCNSCEVKPIRGVRWRCANCADFDLCTDCEAMGVHDKTHIFFKVKIPIPYLSPPRQGLPIMLPGKPELMPRQIPKAARKKLSKETWYEGSEIDALYDQFTCLANRRHKSDPSKVMAAIDREAFDKAFVPGTSVNPPRPNLIFDRLFDFYDTNRDGLIDFEEFILGLETLHKKMDTPSKIRKIFRGYDMDSDGFIGRRDFLRMFRAYYAIQREVTKNCLLVSEEDVSLAANMEIIRGSQPLSSVFTDINFPSNQGRPSQKDENSSVVREDTIETDHRAAVLYASRDLEDPIFDGWEWDDIDLARFPIDREVMEEHRIVEERWRRREFYTDVEEGMEEPDHFIHWEPKDDSTDLRDYDTRLYAQNMPPQGDALGGSQPMTPHSRSSSKVRFRDDPEIETRSNCSTSSRPLGERWGGYEIPEPEQDLGKDVLYQVTQQGLNELLNPLFFGKENLALEMTRSAGERQRWRKEIDEFVNRRERILDESMDFMANMFDDEADENEPSEAPDTDEAPVNDEKGKGKVESAVLEVEEHILNAPLQELLEKSGYGVEAIPGNEEGAHSGNGCAVLSHTLTNGESSKSSIKEDDKGTSLDQASTPNGPVRVETRVPNSVEQDKSEGTTSLQNGTAHGPKPPARSSSPSKATDKASTEQPGPGEKSKGKSKDTHLGETTITEVELPPRETPEVVAVDPTMPQFRPNSSGDILNWVASTSPADTSNDPTPPIPPTTTIHPPDDTAATAAPLPPSPATDPSNSVPTSANPLYAIEGTIVSKASYDAYVSSYKRTLESPPDDSRLQRLAYLDQIDREVAERGGPGRLSYCEFEDFMCGPQGKALGFVEAWLDVGSF
ncbi:hypothetical protein P152DRAFT_453475 [Eremomyces bilateralis CBS 781.70]|uniref:EF-hand n=1 Tax=Eremomyces bilateralis CBS 781.70 TaxID=1392243 RepID=A0A6G1GFJ8_9PEZI|nr:uncharacterized protein P152DRAFT_453475 [Eremomyces bilateralis CBS 781.70]KAF1816857.1 hypothetical protein P152DRAFT_453475 [Eremomyces bilateralis CBS 781.70]